MSFQESVVFRLAADATNVERGVNKSRASIRQYLAGVTADMKKAAAEQYVTDKAGYDRQLQLVKQFERAKTTELSAAAAKRDALRAESARREEYLLKRTADAVAGAEKAKTIATEREAQKRAAWREGLDSARMAQGTYRAREVKNATGVNIENLRRNVTTPGKYTGQYGASIGSIVGGQVAGDIAAGAESKDIVKGVGSAALIGAGSAAGTTAGLWLAKKALSKLLKQFLGNAIKTVGTALGGISAVPIIGAGVAGILGNVQMSKSLKEQEGLYGTRENSADTFHKIGGRLANLVLEARAQGKITEGHAFKMLKALESRQFTGVQSVQRDLNAVGVESFREREAKRLQARLADQGKGTLEGLADQARTMTGTPHRRNYTLTARMRGALKIQDLEEQARLAWERGDDAGMKRYQAQANALREAPWMNLREGDKNPQLKIISQLELIASRLQPVEQMAENVNSQTD